MTERKPPVPMLLANFTWADLMMIGAVSIWGISFSLIKVALDEVPPFAFNALRFPLAVILLLLGWKMQGRPEHNLKADFWALATIGVMGYVGYQMFFVSGVVRTTASNAALIMATVPVFIAVINSWRKSESLGGWAWLGVLLSVAGIALIIQAGDGLSMGRQMLIGNALIVGAAIAWASYTVAAAPYLARHSALGVTVLSMGAATVVLVLIGLPQALTVDWRSVTLLAWIAILYTSILGVAGAYFLWNVGVQRLGGTRASIYSNLVPVIAVITAALTLHEKISALQLIGGAIILIGIGLTRKRSGYKTRELQQS